jgi:hypothetical protein
MSMLAQVGAIPGRFAFMVDHAHLTRGGEVFQTIVYGSQGDGRDTGLHPEEDFHGARVVGS